MKETPIIFDDLQLVPQTDAQAEDAAVQLEREFIEILRKDVGMDERAASEFARPLVRGLRQRMGGGELWIPAPDKTERNAAIRREFTGTRESMAAVMRRYGVTRSTIYKILGKRTKANFPISPL